MLKLFLHIPQVCGFGSSYDRSTLSEAGSSPLCVTLCFFRLSSWENVFPQISHWQMVDDKIGKAEDDPGNRGGDKA